MSISSEIIKSRKLVITRVEGTLTLEELILKQGEILFDPDFDPDFDHLFDMSGVSEVEDISTTELRKVSSVRVFSDLSRRAVVAPGDFEFGLSRMYEVFSRSTEENFSVFRTLDEAMEWLEKD
mgnify:FL=1